MEITVDRNTVYGILVFLALLSLLGLGTLGKPYTPVTTAGDTRLLTWDDWQLLKAERQYTAERDSPALRRGCPGVAPEPGPRSGGRPVARTAH